MQCCTRMIINSLRKLQNASTGNGKSFSTYLHGSVCISARLGLAGSSWVWVGAAGLPREARALSTALIGQLAANGASPTGPLWPRLPLGGWLSKLEALLNGKRCCAVVWFEQGSCGACGVASSLWRYHWKCSSTCLEPAHL